MATSRALASSSNFAFARLAKVWPVQLGFARARPCSVGQISSIEHIRTT